METMLKLFAAFFVLAVVITGIMYTLGISVVNALPF
jgi:hypothetical protein